jgi:hypothetical protein
MGKPALPRKEYCCVDAMITAIANTHPMFLITKKIRDFLRIKGINLTNLYEF